MDEVKINIPTTMVENAMMNLMSNGVEIADKLKELADLNPEDPEEILNTMSKGIDELLALRTIVNDLTVLNELHTLAEMFGGDE